MQFPLHDLINAHHTTRGNVDGGFSSFHKLQRIDLIGHCPQFERAVMSVRPPPNLKALSFQAEGLFPPHVNIHTDLPAQQDTDDTNLLSLLPFLNAPSASVPPKLENIHLICEHSFYQVVLLPGLMQRLLRGAAKAVRKLGNGSAVLMVSSMQTGRYYPPFLYGEPVPTAELMYDGGTDRFGEKYLPREEGEDSSDWEETEDEGYEGPT